MKTTIRQGHSHVWHGNVRYSPSRSRYESEMKDIFNSCRMGGKWVELPREVLALNDNFFKNKPLRVIMLLNGINTKNIVGVARMKNKIIAMQHEDLLHWMSLPTLRSGREIMKVEHEAPILLTKSKKLTETTLVKYQRWWFCKYAVVTLTDMGISIR